MTPEVLVDLTRLATRMSRPAPNGIDRVDLMFAQHFFEADPRTTGVVLGPLGPRRLSNSAGRAVVAAIAAHWREDGRIDDDVVCQRLRARLLGRPTPMPSQPVSPAKGGWSEGLATAGRLLRSGHVFGHEGWLPGRSLARTVAPGAVYLNVSQFPLWIDAYFGWLRRRRDVKAVFFLHDVLPITLPEFFPVAEARRHRRRLEVLSGIAKAVIVAAAATGDQLARFLKMEGLPQPRIIVQPLPVPPPFLAPAMRDRDLQAVPYFVSVGTLEPRKNHLLLLQVWRELAGRMGRATPKLVLIGARGWDNENVIDMIERCPALQGVVLEVRGLSSPGLRSIVANARAMLLPAFAEGYGLPLIEAAALATPILAADTDIFRAVAGGQVDAHFIDPVDGLGWLAAVQALAGEPLADARPVSTPPRAGAARSNACYFCHLEGVIATL